MSKIRLPIPVLVVVLAVSGAMSASAYAGHTWVVKGTKLGSGETSSAKVSFGKLTIKWEDSSSKAKFEAECNKASGEAELKGGGTGKDEMRSLKLKECVLIKAGKACELTVGGVTTEELPGWATELELKSGKVYDGITGASFSLILEGCEKASLSKTWLFRGNLKVEVTNETSKVKTVLPTTPVGGDTLKSEGAEASLSGNGEMTEGEGGSLQIGVEEPSGKYEWLQLSGGTWIPISGAKLVLSEGVGNQILTVPAAGAEIVCSLLHGHGDIFPGGTDEILSLVYSMCIVAKPTGCGYVSSPGEPNGTIALAPGLPTELKLTAGGLLVDEIKESPVLQEFVTLSIRKEASESSAKCGLIPKNSVVAGTDYAIVNNAAQTLESVGEGTLKALGALEAKYTGIDKQELAGGGAFLGVEL